MPVPSAPTGLTVVPSNDDGWLAATWTNVGASLTGSKIEKTLDAGANWTVEYDGALVSARKLYPIPGQVTGWRVYSKNASGTSLASSAVLGVTLGLHGQIGFPMSLVSVDDPTKKVLALGVGDGSQLPGFANLLSRSDIQPAGAIDPTYFYGTQRVLVAQGMTFKLVPYNRSDGTRVTAQAQENVLMALEGPSLLWRDAGRVQAVYCKLANAKPQYSNNVMRLVSCDLKSMQPPALPLTST